MSSHYSIVNNNYIIVNNIFNDCIISLCGFRFFWDTLYSAWSVMKIEINSYIVDGLGHLYRVSTPVIYFSLHFLEL